MKRLILLFLTLVSVALAEQRIFVLNVHDNERPRLEQVESLLAQGWRVVQTSAAGNGDGSTRHFTYVFVVESPASAPAAPAQSNDTKIMGLDFRALTLTTQQESVTKLNDLIKAGWQITGISHEGPMHITFGLRGPNP